MLLAQIESFQGPCRGYFYAFIEVTACMVSEATISATIYKIVGLVSVLLLAGVLARQGMRVNYTRKINHFAIFFIPVFVDQQLDSETFTSVVYLSISAAATLGFLAIFLEPVRKRVPLFQLMFEGFDRPEDRPNTLLWLWTQYAAGFAIMVPMIWRFTDMGYESLVTIPILINAIGDGLAEPVGIRYGKRKYTVKALFTDQTFTRSIEGSSAVFITGILVMFLYAAEFTSLQLLIGLALVPIAMTVTEAYSPHAWDTPFLMLVGYGTLMTVLQF